MSSGAEQHSDEDQKKAALDYIDAINKSGALKRPVVTEVVPLKKFYEAEAYHQKYYQQNPEHFEAFEKGSGRVLFKEKTWQ